MKNNDWNLDITMLRTPTEREMEINKYYLNECERLGIDVRSFNEAYDTSGVITKNELKAMAILREGKKLPRKLEQRLLDTREDRMKKRGSSESHELVLTLEEEAEFSRLYGINFKEGKKE